MVRSIIGLESAKELKGPIGDYACVADATIRQVSIVAIPQTERSRTDNKIVQFPQRLAGTDRRRRALHPTNTGTVLQLPRPRPAPPDDNSDRIAIMAVAFVLAVIIAAIGIASLVDLEHTQDCFPASQCTQVSLWSF
jgi:hypothetical protein